MIFQTLINQTHCFWRSDKQTDVRNGFRVKFGVDTPLGWPNLRTFDFLKKWNWDLKPNGWHHIQQPFLAIGIKNRQEILKLRYISKGLSVTVSTRQEDFWGFTIETLYFDYDILMMICWWILNDDKTNVYRYLEKQDVFENIKITNIWKKHVWKQKTWQHILKTYLIQMTNNVFLNHIFRN